VFISTKYSLGLQSNAPPAWQSWVEVGSGLAAYWAGGGAQGALGFARFQLNAAYGLISAALKRGR
jgi:hypothetical protein